MAPPCLAPRLQTAKLLVLFAILQQEHVVVGHNTGILCMSQPACRRPPSRSANRILARRLSRPKIEERHDARNLRDGFRVGFPFLLAGKRTLGIPQWCSFYRVAHWLWYNPLLAVLFAVFRPRRRAKFRVQDIP